MEGMFFRGISIIDRLTKKNILNMKKLLLNENVLDDI